MSMSLPGDGLQLQSTLDSSGLVTIALTDAPVRAPGERDVVVRVEAAPINPSDMIPLFARGDPASAQFAGTHDRPEVRLQLTPEQTRAGAGRVGQPLPIGLEGAGKVIAAGSAAAHLIGKTVSFLSLQAGALGHYCTVSLDECAVLPEGVSAAQGADLFCNPMTALAMVETLHQLGEKALVHTAAASNLGQMLVRICKEDGVPLVNVVRRAEHVELLRDLGASHVCDSSAPDFEQALQAAIAETGARVAFDAIGGGAMAGQLMAAMEAAAAARMGGYSAYGSFETTRVYIYGLLDPAPTRLEHTGFGFSWSVEGWAMPPVLERAGPGRTRALTQRVLENLTTTFASHYGQEVSLAQALQREALLGYTRKASGGKFLVRPWA